MSSDEETKPTLTRTETNNSGIPVESSIGMERALVERSLEPVDCKDTGESQLQDDEQSSDLTKTYYCGLGPFHPQVIQVFANKKVFTMLLCFYIVIQGSIVAGLNSVNVSSLETRYSFSSTLAGLLFAIYDLTIVIGVVFISYAGGKTNKPRFMAISLIILSIGNFVMASPQLFFGSYKESSGSESNYETCMPSSTSDDCSATNIGAYIIFVIAQIVLGIGGAAVYTVGIAYIDEIVYPRFVSLHIGVVLLCGVIGPAIGYLLGSLFLSVYVDPWIETDLDPSNPNWVGAWWIGLVIMGSLGLILSVPFLMFPKWLPDSHLVRIERAKEMAKVYPSELVNEDTLTLTVKEFPIHIKHLLTNASFMLTAFALAMIFVIKDSVVVFGPKYLESMFRVTATTAGLLIGGVGITAAAIGVATGALIVYFWKPKGRQTTIIQFVVVLVSLPFVLLFVLKCPSYNVAGIVVPYGDGAFDGKDSSNCSMNCSCQSSVFEPVCGTDGITYFSPCRAGCVQQMGSDGMFENCSCIAESSTSTIYNGTAVDGLCSVGCYQLLPFMIILFILVVLLLTIEIPYFHYTLRVVADDQRHLALGLQSAIYRVFGSIPGPLLFGAVIDLACVEWEDNCGVRGNCWIYDNDRLGVNALLLCLPFGILSAILFFLAMITYPKKTATKEDTNEVIANNEK